MSSDFGAETPTAEFAILHSKFQPGSPAHGHPNAQNSDLTPHSVKSRVRGVRAARSGVIYTRKLTNVSGGFRMSIFAVYLGSMNVFGRRWSWEWGAREDLPLTEPGAEPTSVPGQNQLAV